MPTDSEQPMKYFRDFVAHVPWHFRNRHKTTRYI